MPSGVARAAGTPNTFIALRTEEVVNLTANVAAFAVKSVCRQSGLLDWLRAPHLLRAWCARKVVDLAVEMPLRTGAHAVYGYWPESFITSLFCKESGVYLAG